VVYLKVLSWRKYFSHNSSYTNRDSEYVSLQYKSIALPLR